MNSSGLSGADNEVVSADKDITPTSLPADSCNSQSEMKRIAAKKKIERYYYQLTDGCGDPLCDNELCASSSTFLYLGINRNDAAAKAVELYMNRSRLCDVSSKKVSKISENEADSSIKSDGQSNSSLLTLQCSNNEAISKVIEKVVLNEERLISTIDEAERTNNWTSLATLLFSSFSNPEILKESFSGKDDISKDECRKKSEKVNNVGFKKVKKSSDSKDAVKDFRAKEIDGGFEDMVGDEIDGSFEDDECRNKSEAVNNVGLEEVKKPSNSKEDAAKDSKAHEIDGSFEDDDGDQMIEGSAVDGPGYHDGEVSGSELDGVVVYEGINETAAEQRNSFLTKLFGTLEESVFNVSSLDYEVTVNVESLSRCYDRLSRLADTTVYCEQMKAALIHLSRRIESSLHSGNEKDSLVSDPKLPNIYAIILEMPLLDSLELLEDAVPNFYSTVRFLPLKCQVALVKHWAKRYGELPNGALIMRRVVCAIQQMITVRVVIRPWAIPDQTVNDDDEICGAVILLKLFYYASMLGGRMDEKWLERKTKESTPLGDVAAKKEMSKFQSSFSISDDDEDGLENDKFSFNDMSLRGYLDFSKDRQSSSTNHRDPLGEALGLRSVDCREPLLSPKEFVNETLSEAVEMDKDYAYYRVRPEWRFSFMANPFILTTAAKQMGLYFDNRIRMFDERRATLFQNVLYAGTSTGPLNAPYLRLNVRRDHIVGDALVNLETITMNSPQDLKKQLFVEFEGEQGVDEGGVSKEFFQLIVEELFNPDFGMFRLDEETQSFWFNELSFENDAEFTLIGILIGLAIYNNVILDIRFPMVLYRKLLSRKGNFDDLIIARPTLGRSLLSLLNYDGNVEDLLQNFSINTTDVFGNVLTHDLKPGGGDIPVTNDNRKEFVELYADFLLNKSVVKQFKAFRRGFRLVTDESPLAQLFDAEELELLICGSEENSDFHALEQSTEYDGGYKKETPVVRYFWETVHEMTEDQKKKLLQFTTGSDRVPIGGLAKLRLIIARNGQDTDRLPTSHTCFNVLLLPEYSTKDKLKERLLKAITYSKGFGML